MNDIVLSIYINFLMMNDKTVDVNKIQRTLWPLIRDDKNEDLSERFDQFVFEYAKDPSDLDTWPIIRFFDIWSK